MRGPRDGERARWLDGAVATVFLARLVPLVAAPVTLLLLAALRPPAEQGFYFVLLNVQAFAQVAEVGMGTLVVQYVAHESADLDWSAGGALCGDRASLERLSLLVRAALRWYARAGALVLLLLPLGLVLFRERAEGTGVSYVGAWCVTVALTALYLPLVPLVCLVEGSGRLRAVQRMRLVQALAVVAALWLGIVALDSLRGVALAAVAWTLTAAGWLGWRHRALLGQLRRWSRSSPPPADAAVTRFGADQWRSAAVWMSLWLAPQLLAPLVLLADGPSAAGRVGLSLALATAPATLGVAWLHGRYPRYAALAAAGRWQELDALARRALLQALGVCGALGVGVTSTVAALGWLAPRLAERALSPLGVAALCVSSLGWVTVQGCAAWLRAERAEPLVRPAVMLAACVAAASATAASWMSTVGLVGTYATVVVLGAAALYLRTTFETRRRHRRMAGAVRVMVRPE